MARIYRFFFLISFLLVSMALSSSAQSAVAAAKEQLWFQAPAPIWDMALPIGNGRLGAMVFGGANLDANNGDLQDSSRNAPLMDGSHTRAADEHLQLNESSLWQGGRVDRLNPKAAESFPEIRRLMLESKGENGAKISAAEKLAESGLIAPEKKMPGYSTLGDLYLRSPQNAPVTDYRRQLDLATGVVSASYLQDGVRYTREVFASVPDEVIVLRITADHPHAISFRASMDRPEDFTVRANQNTLILRESKAHIGQIHFAGQARLLPTGGTLRTDGSELVLSDADSVTILIAAATDFRGGSFAGGDPEVQCERTLQAAAKRSVDSLLAAQLALYQPLYQRLTLHLGTVDTAAEALPVDERVRRVSAGQDDLGLQQLYFQFARYLLIASSRPDGLPANLQGIWASGINNPWGSKWTVNINAEMNYWLAEPAGLSETTLPLINLIDMVRNPATGTGTQVAKKYYNARGFVIHHNTDLWGDAEPIDGYRYGIWPVGGAWMALHAWDHYAFTQDRAFLQARAWPILQEASLFFLDYLVDDGAGHLVTGPSLSPENRYKLPDGSTHSLTMAPTMDIEIVRELFTRTLDTGKILHEDPAFLQQIEAAKSKLPPFAIGKLGQLQEWQQDYTENDPGHRHISHLWALFPGTQISLAHTPELAEAARVALKRRLDNGGGQTGWSRAWVVNYWDHLHDGPKAYESMQVLFRQSTFPNLMDTHPPGVFQIDGNLGAANGMLEALVQSRWLPDASELELLPALPPQWSNGEVHGVHVRGGAVVDLQWKAGKASLLRVHATSNNQLRLLLPSGQVLGTFKASDGSTGNLVGNLLTMQKGTLYEIMIR